MTQPPNGIQTSTTTKDTEFLVLQATSGRKKFLSIEGNPVRDIIARNLQKRGLNQHSCWIRWCRTPGGARYPVDLDAGQRDAIIGLTRDLWKQKREEKLDEIKSRLADLDSEAQKMDAISRLKLCPPEVQHGRYFYGRLGKMPSIDQWMPVAGLPDEWVRCVTSAVMDSIAHTEDHIRYIRKDVRDLDHDLSTSLEWIKVSIRTDVTTSMQPI